VGKRINGYDFETCSHCGLPGNLGPELRAHAVTVSKKDCCGTCEKKVLRLLHVESCTAEWFAKYDGWLKNANGQV
jgi:hypothetical protein